MSVTANTTYTASFPKRPDITGAPNQVYAAKHTLRASRRTLHDIAYSNGYMTLTLETTTTRYEQKRSSQ